MSVLDSANALIGAHPWPKRLSLTPSCGLAFLRWTCARESLRKQGVRIKLQEQPFHVLTILLQRAGEVVTWEELRNRNWPDTFVDFDNSLNTAINKLREALGDSGDNPRFIETLPRRCLPGYSGALERRGRRYPNFERRESGVRQAAIDRT